MSANTSIKVKKWFVLRVGANREKGVKNRLSAKIATDNLGELISEVRVVTERVTEFKAGKRRTVERKVYPGYIMVEIAVDEETGEIPSDVWHLIRETPGQIRFVGDSDEPKPLSDKEATRMQQQVARFDAEEVSVAIDFEVGERVRIREGAFEGFEGDVEGLQPEKGIVKVSIMVFGRATPIDFECWKIEKTTD